MWYFYVIFSLLFYVVFVMGWLLFITSDIDSAYDLFKFILRSILTCFCVSVFLAGYGSQLSVYKVCYFRLMKWPRNEE